MSALGTVTYDLELFERLNEEYATKPLVPRPPRIDPVGRRKRARRNLNRVRNDVDFEGKDVLEIGCAFGEMTRLAVKRAGARSAVGVDVRERAEWDQLRSKRVSYHVADLATEPVVEPGSVDLVVSNAVFEHVTRPLQMLDAMARVLRTGGKAWLYFNLHRGPRASHRYREIFFPWPHLLFEPEVAASFYRKHHERNGGFAWVNRLTAAEYFGAFHELGLRVESYRPTTAEIDLDFYRRFDNKLGRYPALDLEWDFLTVVLEKRRHAPRKLPTLPYVERQHALDEALQTAP